MQVLPGELRDFEPEQELRTDSGSGDGSGDDGPAQRGDEGISETAAKAEINSEGDEVGEALEEEVRMDDGTAEVNIDGEGGGMERCGDGGIIATGRDSRSVVELRLDGQPRAAVPT